MNPFDTALHDAVPFHDYAAETQPGKIMPAFIPISCLERCWLETNPPPRDMIVEGVLPAGRVGALLSPGGGFKSTVAATLGTSVSAGFPWLDLFPVLMPGPVVFIGAEDELQEAHRRVKKILKGRSQDVQKAAMAQLYFESRVGLQSLITSTNSLTREVTRTRFLDELLEALRLITDLRLIILDPWSRFRGGDENAAQDATRGVEAAEYLAKETGAAVLLIHHTGKAASLNGNGDSQHAARGSSALVDGCRFVWNLSGLTPQEAKKYGISEDQRRDYVRLSNSKSNYCRRFDDVFLNMAVGVKRVELSDCGKVDDDTSALVKVKNLIESKALIGIRFTKRSFTDAFSGITGPVGLSKAALHLLLTEAVASGRLVVWTLDKAAIKKFIA